MRFGRAPMRLGRALMRFGSPEARGYWFFSFFRARVFFVLLGAGGGETQRGVTAVLFSWCVKTSKDKMCENRKVVQVYAAVAAGLSRLSPSFRLSRWAMRWYRAYLRAEVRALCFQAVKPL